MAALVFAFMAPAAPAAADDLELGTCPNGYRGVVVAVSTGATGYREVRLCLGPSGTE